MFTIFAIAFAVVFVLVTLPMLLNIFVWLAHLVISALLWVVIVAAGIGLFFFLV